MRVLIFSTAYIPFVGGAEIAVKEITDRLGDEIEFDLLTCRLKRGLPDIQKIGNVTVYRVGPGIATIDKLCIPFIGAYKVLKMQKQNGYNAYWCIMATYASGAAYISNVLRHISFKKQIPIILTLQEGDSEEHLTKRFGGLLHLSWKLALTRSTVLTAISTYLLDRGHKLGFNGTSFLIPNGVDTEMFSMMPPLSSLQTLKQKLNKEEGNIFIITTSRLNIKNAVEDTISALKYLPTNVKFIILGVGELEGKLKLQVEKLGLEDRVRFAGLIPYADIPSYLHVSDIFIRPSLSEGMGNSFIEAMAAGVPIIATPVGGITDFLFDPLLNPNKPSTGLFAKIHDPKSIASQVEQLMRDERLKHTIIQNAKKLVREKYEWNLVAKDMKEKVFRHV